jgi:ribosome-binding factor A
MLVKFNFSKERKEELYRREVARILYKITQENNFPSLSLSYCALRGKQEFLQIYLNFSQREKQDKFLNLINEKYLPVIKKELAKSKKFSYIPNLVVLADKETEKFNDLEEIIHQIS